MVAARVIISAMTKLEKPLKRELAIGDQTYVVTIAPEGLKLTLKGHRKGREFAWRDLVGGDGAAASSEASLEEHGATEPST